MRFKLSLDDAPVRFPGPRARVPNDYIFRASRVFDKGLRQARDTNSWCCRRETFVAKNLNYLHCSTY